ncbi:RagB/SusD family nutrient uptake outer membrane protein [Labilibaculum sp. DW002]|uniref:RagB/SusD family nutrient uptake outer membrane protein n=1 Tax=Paralabilibaculum antarcticum TaxID=2912572 RepID=A0ABT5VPM1_9BACT|nr:RagB/SusD family nutrient uptake outer membrane protein [Labilibaculum sp. DW002]MDE5417386.1 RagB/SusD family nutrient uptake outer membrane protein [Labilibaculum sp. DW002]
MKMFRKTKYISLLASALIGFTACNSYIEEDNYTNLTSESYITEDNADQLVVGVYQSLRDVYKDYSLNLYGTDLFTQQNELFAYNTLNEYFDINDGNGSAASYWKSNYELVSNANVVISRYNNDVSWSAAKEDDKNYGLAQAKSLRALAFYNLVQQFGGVVLELAETNSIRADYARSSEEECYSLIISDLEESIPNLMDSPETGRLSKRAAQHLLADVYLTRGYKSFAGADDFSTAASLAELAIGSYDIRSQSYAQVFDFDNQENAEVLFAVQYGTGTEYADRNNNKHSILMNQVFNYPGVSRANPYGQTSISIMPTEFFFGLLADNDTRDAATLHRAIIATEAVTYETEFGVNEVNVGDTVVYYPKTALSTAELATKLNSYYVYQPDEYYYGIPENVDGAIYQYSTNQNRTNFPIFKKFDDQGFDGAEGGYRDCFVFRVAESHLIAAEAYLEAGNVIKALEHLNIVRERATGVVDSYSSITIDNILDERAVELAGEENRWAVLKRSGKLEERINLYNPHVIDHGSFDANIHLLRPIPEHELNLSDGSLEQNYGY